MSPNSKKKKLLLAEGYSGRTAQGGAKWRGLLLALASLIGSNACQRLTHRAACAKHNSSWHSEKLTGNAPLPHKAKVHWHQAKKSLQDPELSKCLSLSFELQTAVAVFWDKVPCTLVEIYWRFGWKLGRGRISLAVYIYRITLGPWILGQYTRKKSW
jgi:hypothetical protein